MSETASNGITAKESRVTSASNPRAARPPGVDQLSEEELTSLIAAAQAELAARHEKKCTEYYASVVAGAEALGLDPAEVAAALKAKSKPKRAATDGRATVKPKWRNPENPAQTWAGRGKPPAWIEMSPDGKTPLPKFAIE